MANNYSTYVETPTSARPGHHGVVQVLVANHLNALARGTSQDCPLFKNEVIRAAMENFGWARPVSKKPWTHYCVLCKQQTSCAAPRRHGLISTPQQSTQNRYPTGKNSGAIRWRPWRLVPKATICGSSSTFSNSKPLPALFLSQGQSWKHPLNQSQKYQLLAWAFQWALEDPILYRQSITNPDCSTLAKVKATMANFKNSKATDISTITAEMLKAWGGDDIILWLTKIFNLVWVSKSLPDDWRPGIIHPFW